MNDSCYGQLARDRALTSPATIARLSTVHKARMDLDAALPPPSAPPSMLSSVPKYPFICSQISHGGAGV